MVAEMKLTYYNRYDNLTEKTAFGKELIHEKDILPEIYQFV